MEMIFNLRAYLANQLVRASIWVLPRGRYRNELINELRNLHYKVAVEVML